VSHHLPTWAQEMGPGYRGPTIAGTLGLFAAGTTSHQPSALLNTGRGTRSPKSSTAPIPPSAHRLVAPP
jgi:hypothetical protein